MRFQSMNKRYVITSRDVTRDNYGRKIGDIKGLSAEFTGKGFPRTFDSVEAARQNRWTEEERLEVERFLLSDPEFGTLRTVDGGGSLDRQLGNINVYELYLASGQAIPKEHLEFVKDLRWYQIDHATIEAEPEEVIDTCIWVGPNPEIPEETIACPKKSLKGSHYCRQHSTVKV
jgi:hypothetical protein